MAVALAVGGIIPNTAYAKTLQGGNYDIVSPLWDNISDISPRISSSGTTLYPEAYIGAKKSTALISGTMYLEKYSSSGWINVTSWSFKGTSSVSVSKSYKGTSGITYRTRIIVTVDGEKTEATSGSCKI